MKRTYVPPSPPLPSAAEPNREKVLLGLIIAVAVIAAYHTLPDNLFVLYDDPEYLTENAAIAGGMTREGIGWAFRTFHQGNWHPLTWLSHMLDIEMFGLNPAGHHLTALLLHLANTLILYFVVGRMTGSFRRSGAVALLWGLHPLRVESVAWAAERKDLLSAFFWLLTVAAYVRYARRPGCGRYALLALMFLLGLLAKPMLVTLPLILLLLDRWPLRRMTGFRPPGPLLAEKIPLLVLSAAVSIVTYIAQKGAGTVTPLRHSLLTNAGNAAMSYAAYLGKTLWPCNLAIVYPFDPANVTPVPVAISLFLLFIVTAAVLRLRERPYLAVGWLWFLGALVPVIGIIRVGNAAMADRYTYLPHIGLFIAVIWGVAELLPPLRVARRITGGATAAIGLIFMLLTMRQLGHWKDGISLMERAVSVTSGNWFAYNNLGASYILIGTGNRSVNISRSLPLDPQDDERRRRYLAKAIAASRESLKINPDYPLAHFNLGLAYLHTGNDEEAAAEYRRLLVFDEGIAEELRRIMERKKRLVEGVLP